MPRKCEARSQSRRCYSVSSSHAVSSSNVTKSGNISVSKIRRGNFVFLQWVGDHSPRHVPVYIDGRLVVKWDLENGRSMEGEASKRVRRLIDELEGEGKL